MKTKAKRRRFHYHASVVAKEHFLNEDLNWLARRILKKAWRPEYDGSFYVRDTQAYTGKDFVVAVKPNGNDVHLWIDTDLERLVNAVREIFPDCPMTCAL
jgi:hypothetical protein